jgi:hypothetical protein
MRIWDISPRKLCRNHLLGEHRELHAIWSVITNKKKGYSHHPEVLRWVGKLKALSARHEAQVEEMQRRGYRHKSPLNSKLVKDRAQQNTFITPVKTQLRILKNKRCLCNV